MPNFFTPALTLSIFFSNSNSGVCTPTITSPLSAYFAFQSTRYGSVLIQLMQLYVQKSTSTTLPFKSTSFIGLVFMYPDIPANSGAFLNCDLSTVYCVFDILPVALSTATEDKKSPA